MNYITTPVNVPPTYCTACGIKLRESKTTEGTYYDLTTGEQLNPGKWVKTRWCPVYWPPGHPNWTLHEDSYNWISSS